MEKLESDRRGYPSGGLFSNTPSGPLPASSASLDGAHSQQRVEPADYPYDNVFNEKQGFNVNKMSTYYVVKLHHIWLKTG